MESNAIEIRGLTKRYKDFALEDLNLDLPYGCVLGLVGENGAGKSTTIRLIMDALERDGGTVSVLGADNRSPDFLRRKEDVGVVLDETFVPEILTARQLGRIMAGTFRSWDQAAYEKWIARLELPEGKKFKEYSRGMTMKLGIAAALSHNAKLLLLDEATSGLDPIRGLRRPGRPRGAPLQPHCQRSGADLRLHRLSPPGEAGAVRGEGRAAGHLRHPQVLQGAAGQHPPGGRPRQADR